MSNVNTALTFGQAQQVHTVLSSDRVMYPVLRNWASNRLVERFSESECGSSDVSIELTEALRYYEVPLVGPVVAAYEQCGFTTPTN